MIIEINSEENIKFKVNGMVLDMKPTEDLIERQQNKTMRWIDFCKLFENFLVTKNIRNKEPEDALQMFKRCIGDFFSYGE